MDGQVCVIEKIPDRIMCTVANRNQDDADRIRQKEVETKKRENNTRTRGEVTLR